MSKDTPTHAQDVSSEKRTRATSDAPPRKRLRKRVIASRTIGVLIGFSVSAFLVLFVLFALSIMGRSLPLPSWVVTELEDQLNAQSLGDRRIDIERVTFGLHDAAFRPTFDLLDVSITDGKDADVLTLPQLRTKFDTSELLQGRVAIETFEVKGATLRLERAIDGEISLGFEGAGEVGPVTRSLDDVLGRIDNFFENNNLREFEEFLADDLVLDFLDRRADTRVLIENGRLSVVNGSDTLSATASFQLAMNQSGGALLHFSAEKLRGREGAKVIAKFEDLDAHALSSQVTALSWMNVLDAPVNGALTAQIAPEGFVTDLAGTLNIARGRVVPNAQAEPLMINSAQTYIRYKAETGRVHFDQIQIDAPALRLNATGHADLRDLEAGLPKTILGQLQFDDLRLDPATMFENAVEFDGGSLDLRYRPDDLQAEIGQLTLRKGEVHIVAKGKVTAQPEGWAAALDAKVANVGIGPVLELWPVTAAPKTRDWLGKNILGGTLQGATAALRLQPGAKLTSAVTFDFTGAEVSYLKTLPPVRDASGYVSILDRSFHLAVHDGVVTAPDKSILKVGGMHMTIPNMGAKPASAIFEIDVDGSVPGALSFLDEKPFEFMSKAGLPTDFATGDAQAKIKLNLPLKKQETGDEIKYEVAASVRQLKTDTLIEGRSLTSDEMQVTAKAGRLRIEGKGQLDGVPIDVAWARALGKDADPTSQVTGKVELSPASLATFGVTLPDGGVYGSGSADITLDLAPDTPPELRLSSDLQGVGLRIEALDYNKRRASTGDLRLEMQLGPQPRVRKLTITAAGLQADGRVELTGNGELARAVLSPLRVGDKLNSRVEIIGRGKGNPVRLAVQGGTIDIRKFGVGQSTAASGPRINLTLDKLVITDSIALDNFRGEFRNNRGVSGRFEASVNGQADVEGVVSPTANGIAIKITSLDGGAVMRGAGIFRKARRGNLELILQADGAPGQFNGRLTIKNTYVKKAPVLADLLSAISVIGLLEQLSGDGILFQNVEADFRLGPSGVRVIRSSAVGPSMGISMEGVYNTGNNQMDMRGVVSPIYAVNGLFGRLFSPRRGEGLFGFNYTLRGTGADPRIGVNPLSVFTPGIFREVFRQPVPELPN